MIVKRISKVIISGFLAFIILNLLTVIYRGGSPAVVDETMSTPVRYKPHAYHSQMQEGVFIGFLDENGYNNAFASSDTVDYLCLGSSQMEAIHVMPDQNMVYRLNELFADNGLSDYAYNLGTSGERMPICISHMKNAIDTYDPQKGIVLESAGFDFDPDDVDEANKEVGKGELLYQSNNRLFSLIRQLPYVRLCYVQLTYFLEKKGAEAAEVSEENTKTELNVEDESNAEYIAKSLADAIITNSDGLQVYIIFYPELLLKSDGTARFDELTPTEKAFIDECNDRGIVIIDMRDRFMYEYENNHLLPRGFSNTQIGGGHLNKYGYAMIAEELFKAIQG